MFIAMTTRASSRAAVATSASTPTATAAKRAVSGGSSSALAATANGTGTPTKRPRYVPPMKQEDDDINTPSSSISGMHSHQVTPPIRYSLRRRTASSTSNGVAASAAAEGSEAEENIKGDDVKPTTPRKVKKEQDLFATSPRKKTVKPIKVDLDASEARPAPKRWQEQYQVLLKQRKRIIAPVDTLGCEENGRDDKRQDVRAEESEEKKGKRERFTLLISLMLSSQTKDPVTAEAVHNLQRSLPNGLCLDSILAASQDDISSCINKVGFWRRKTGYIQSAAMIIRDDFDGDVPKTIDELCSLPGVGPKMGFLCLQGAWNINLGIGVDVHVHRVSNRLKWVKSNDPEGTRLQLQSWLPKDLHRSINKTLVGFGQVICQPVGPRCDLCALGAAKLCPSYRKVDPKSVASRVKIELLPETDEEQGQRVSVKEELMPLASESLLNEAAATVKVEGTEGTGALIVKKEEMPLLENDRLAW